MERQITREDKELLLKDLCARLPYKVYAQIPDEYGGHTSAIESIDIYGVVKDFEGTLTEIENIKPYLFPLSSMTDEQEEEYNDLNCYELGCFPHTEEALDYLIKNYFDYRDLIEEGLALDATGLNIY